MDSYTEEDVSNAIFDITENGLSLRRAAEKHWVPKSTLSARMHGRKPRKGSYIGTKLTMDQEDMLAAWIIRQETIGYAPRPDIVRRIATKYSTLNGYSEPIGVNWVRRFHKRHPDIRMKKGRRMEAARFNSFNERAVNWYFDTREGIYGNISPDLTYNMDEGGLMMGQGMALIFVFIIY